MTLDPEPPGLPDTSSSRTQFGLASAAFGPGLGYGVSENLLIDVHASLLSETLSFDDSASDVDSSVTAIYGSLNFLPGSGSARFFLGPMLGLEGASSEAGGFKTSRSSVVLAAKLGVLAFVSRSFSLDPSLTFGYATGSLREEDGTALPATSIDYSMAGTFFGIGFALSGWLGGKPRDESTPPGEATAPEEEHDAQGSRVDSAGSSIPPRPNPTEPREPDGVELTLVLGGANRVRFVSEPDGSEASFAFFLDPNGPDEKCDQVLVRRDGNDVVWTVDQGKVLPTGSSAILSVTGTVSPSGLKPAGAKRSPPKLIVCGREYELADEDRLQIRTFVTRMRRLRPADGAERNAGEADPADEAADGADPSSPKP